MADKYICWTVLGDGKVAYVSDTRHRKGTKIALKKGVGWGYENNVDKALPLSKWWRDRFRADMRATRSVYGERQIREWELHPLARG